MMWHSLHISFNQNYSYEKNVLSSLFRNGISYCASTSSNKSDVNNVLIHFGTDTVVGCHKWVMFATDRSASTGTSYVDFEFLQNTLTKNAGGTFTSGASNATGGRTVNDLLFSVEYSG